MVQVQKLNFHLVAFAYINFKREAQSATGRIELQNTLYSKFFIFLLILLLLLLCVDLYVNPHKAIIFHINQSHIFMSVYNYIWLIVVLIQSEIQTSS